MSFQDVELTQRMRDSRVLVVDDAEFNRAIIEEILAAASVSNVKGAASGKQALDMLAEFTPDIIILDLMMPEMDGFECLEHIRKTPGHETTPVIIQTAMGNADERLQAFQRGANDLITKPLNPYEFISRFKLHLGYRYALADLQEYHMRVNEELSIARDMQMDMLPSLVCLEAYKESHNLQISSVSRPSSELGGDVWGIQPIDDHRVAIFIFDISGHGVSAAINAVRLHTLMNLQKLTDMPVNELLGELNNKVHGMFDTGSFATCFMGVIDTKDNILHYSVAASTESLLLHRQDDETETLQAAGLPLGAAKDAAFDSHACIFEKGDTLLLYSDALIESKIANTGKFLEQRELAEIFKRHARSSTSTPEQAHQRIIFETLEKIGVTDHQALDDDLTLVLFTRE